MFRSAIPVLLLAAGLHAPHAIACDRTLAVGNVTPGGGPVSIAVFTDPQSFRKTPAAKWRLDASAQTVTVPLCEIRSEWLAVTAFQDLDGNGRLNSNPLGLPKEPWGASGWWAPFLPPTWAASRVPGDSASVKIELSR